MKKNDGEKLNEKQQTIMRERIKDREKLMRKNGGVRNNVKENYIEAMS